MVVAIPGVMNEEKRARVGDTAETPRKSPRLDRPAAATAAAAAAAPLTSNGSILRCQHVFCFLHQFLVHHVHQLFGVYGFRRDFLAVGFLQFQA